MEREDRGGGLLTQILEETEQRNEQADAAVVDEIAEEETPICTCCQPVNPLVERPDLGDKDGHTRFAICVLHNGEPTIYEWSGSAYVQAPELHLDPSGNIYNGNTGAVEGEPSSGGFSRLGDLDDDEEPSRPKTSQHVDLTEDDFY